MTASDNDIAALFDPKVEDPVPVILPGSLPPSWAAAQSSARRPAQARSEADPTPVPDYDDNGEDDYDEDTEPTPFTDPEPVAEKAIRRRGRRGRTTTKARKSATDREKDAAKKRVERERRAVHLKLTGTSANITRTATTSTAWFWQQQGPWNFRTTTKQRRFIQDEAMILTNLQKAGVRNLHRRLARTPFPVTQWADDPFEHDQVPPKELAQLSRPCCEESSIATRVRLRAIDDISNSHCNSWSGRRCRSTVLAACGSLMTIQYTIPGTALELPRWLNPAPRGSPKKALARAVMWGGYVHLPKGVTHPLSTRM